ncbi:MAG: retropepsin-like aspartic protease [Chthoniobacterales bacterium]
MAFRSAAISSLLIVALAPPTIALCASSPTRVPFAAAGNLVFLDVRLNGSRPLSFVLDTGAARMVVDAEVSRELRLAEAEADTIGGAGAGRVPVRKVHGVELEIGGLKSGGYEFVAAELSGVSAIVGRQIDGIIGYEFLRRFVLTIDYAKREVLLRDPQSTEGIGGEEVPIRFEKGWAFVRGTLQVAGMDEITDDFLLDSGSDDAVNHPVAAKAADRAATRTGNGLGTPVDGFIATASSFRLGNHLLHDLPISSGGATAQTSKLIGGAVLSRFTVTLDYPHARIFLAPRQAG